MTIQRHNTLNVAQFSVIIYDRLITGYDEGSVISIERLTPGFNPKKGALGEGGRALTNNFSANVTLSLIATSLDNDFLSDQHNIDLSTGANTSDIEIKDNFGNTELSGTNAYVTNFPNMTRGDELTVMEWTIYVDTLTGRWGGAGS